MFDVDEICSHSETKIVWTSVGSSGYAIRERQLRRQCQSCGCLLKNAVAHALAKANTPDVDIEHLKVFLESTQGRTQIIYDRQTVQAKWKAEMKEKYADYLDSSEWRERHRLVMLRAGGICEGCRTRQASQVHHLTYDNIGEEFLWQLVAVCRSCHERYHGIGG